MLHYRATWAYIYGSTTHIEEVNIHLAVTFEAINGFAQHLAIYYLCQLKFAMISFVAIRPRGRKSASSGNTSGSRKNTGKKTEKKPRSASSGNTSGSRKNTGKKTEKNPRNPDVRVPGSGGFALLRVLPSPLFYGNPDIRVPGSGGFALLRILRSPPFYGYVFGNPDARIPDFSGSVLCGTSGVPFRSGTGAEYSREVRHPATPALLIIE
ncbi:hypothetical protein NDU88_008798 [Pleurodeles waltl]|uniref:Uncharacterized protein n=1 Tax=Pleurodeles waltl TaxID=8319 RepID=A0AAV7N8D3_PLEWA|nr:hypothetical protein NDU88_008798 [Pleurodeles waltl]